MALAAKPATTAKANATLPLASFLGLLFFRDTRAAFSTPEAPERHCYEIVQ
jgi:hypothetical protein